MTNTTETIQIKSRWDNSVIYETQVPTDIPRDMPMYVALEKASASNADLFGADLHGTYLRGANLSKADLASADLCNANLGIANLNSANLCNASLRGADLLDADLSNADLRGADLSYTDLRGANLSYANLRDVNLKGADLRGAHLYGGLRLVGERPFLTIGPIGSAGRTIVGWVTNDGLRVEAGCFFGTREEFVEKLAQEHGDNIHGQEYMAALVLLDAHVRLWTPTN